MQEGVVIEHKGACNCMQGGGCLPLALALAIETALVHFTSTVLALVLAQVLVQGRF